MSETAIKCKNLSKKYKIGHREKYLTLRDSLVHIIKLPFRLLKIGERSVKNEIWALRNVSFELKKGEVLGIIGKNGAGKSTLLKILSRITDPTEGRAEICGRVASLLEVGTGFHDELTGRENIYLNGSILGMTKKEINQKFDNIVQFSGVEKFLDTPVKRFSSGMRVRLAFSVAAHLEPEILLVDEVLAVGDAEFQKKCLGKMDEITRNEGRTIIFVSHNMGAIRKLCTKTLLLESGQITAMGKTEDVINKYLGQEEMSKQEKMVTFKNPKNKISYIKSISLNLPGVKQPVTRIPFLEPFIIEVAVDSEQEINDMIIGLSITDNDGSILTTVHSIEIDDPQYEEKKAMFKLKKGVNIFKIRFNTNFLRPGMYYLSCDIFSRKMQQQFDSQPNAFIFEVDNLNDKTYFDDRQSGVIIMRDVKWEIK